MRSANVQVADGVLHKLLFCELTEYMQGPIWRYGHYSNLNHDRFSFWSSSYFDHRDTREKELPAVVGKVWDFLRGGLLAGHMLERLYANAHTFGVEGGIHQDCKDFDSQTTILYCHPRWNTSWGGNLEIYNEGIDEVVQSVVPRPNRIVSFPGVLPHCAKPLARGCPELRISLVVKTKKPKTSAC
jgi:SM-20-related protein